MRDGIGYGRWMVSGLPGMVTDKTGPKRRE